MAFEPPSPLLGAQEHVLLDKTEGMPAADGTVTVTELELLECKFETGNGHIRSPSPVSQRPFSRSPSPAPLETSDHNARYSLWRKVMSQRIIPRRAIVYATTLVLAIILATFSGAAAFAHLCSDSTVSLLEPVPLNIDLILARAKVLDFVFSAVVIPLILAVFNFVAFQLLRTSSLHEHQWNKTSVIVATLVELSTTNWGSYSPSKFWSLVSSREVRCVLTAVTTVLAAVSYSCLTNIIGYQAAEATMQNQTLEYIYQPPMAIESCTSNTSWFDGGTALLCPNANTWSPGRGLLPSFAGGTQLPFFNLGLRNAISGLQRDDYKRSGFTTKDFVGVNASLPSLTDAWTVGQPGSQIPGVGIFRLTYACNALDISSFDLQGLAINGTPYGVVTITAEPSTNYYSVLPFEMKFLNETCVSLVGFNDNSTMFGKLCPTNGTNHHFVTEFGNVQTVTKLFDWSRSDLSRFAGSGNQSLELHGINCSFWEQQGYGAIHQDQEQARLSSLSSWLVDSVDHAYGFSSYVLTTPMSWQLQLFAQIKSAAGYGSLGGLGDLIASSQAPTEREDATETYNWNNLVASFAFLEGSMRFLVYNAIQNDPLFASNTLTYNIRMKMTRDNMYTMTYVPWLLLAGMTALSLAALLTLLVAASSLNSEGFRKGRLLHPLRMVMDLGNLFDPETFADSQTWSDNALAQWSMQTMFVTDSVTTNSPVPLRSSLVASAFSPWKRRTRIGESLLERSDWICTCLGHRWKGQPSGTRTPTNIGPGHPLAPFPGFTRRSNYWSTL
ncbi:hypothetical protein OHC33_002672 [Knufia fluminis]|uniref:Uncharacterized protein n=1 Tax=Knufia fluminis TaxID=191047 RepID=A0AAN8EHP0_9EURO|nr:hypothetical protein OHC33_002672 [Knufia fluminis]